jgi:ABC-2 type transport system permease protein
MLVLRHTRAEEEAGRLELLGATEVGRTAPLTAAIVVAVGTSLAIAALSTLGLFATGLPARGSIAFGLAWAATGAAFTAVGALAAQLTTGGRAATGGRGVLRLVYVLRAAGDTAGAGGQGSRGSPTVSQQVLRSPTSAGASSRFIVFAVAVGTVGARSTHAATALALVDGRPATAQQRLSTPSASPGGPARALLAWSAAHVLLGRSSQRGFNIGGSSRAPRRGLHRSSAGRGAD